MDVQYLVPFLSVLMTICVFLLYRFGKSIVSKIGKHVISRNLSADITSFFLFWVYLSRYVGYGSILVVRASCTSKVRRYAQSKWHEVCDQCGYGVADGVTRMANTARIGWHAVRRGCYSVHSATSNA